MAVYCLEVSASDPSSEALGTRSRQMGGRPYVQHSKLGFSVRRAVSVQRFSNAAWNPGGKVFFGIRLVGDTIFF